MSGIAQTLLPSTREDTAPNAKYLTERHTVGVAPLQPLEVYGRKIQQQVATRAAIAVSQGLAASLSRRRLANAGRQPSTSRPKAASSLMAAASQRAHAKCYADRVQLNGVRAQLRAQQRQLQRLTSELVALHPSLPACARLPVELHWMIFEALSTELATERDTLQATRLPWLLSAVCSSWRSMTRQLPHLWTYVHFPIRADARHDRDLHSHAHKQISLAIRRSVGISLRLSVQEGAHICDQRYQADEYRANLQRILNHTTDITIVDHRLGLHRSRCNACHHLFASTAYRMTLPLLWRADFIADKDPAADCRIDPHHYLPPSVCTQLQLVVFTKAVPTLYPNHLSQVGEVTIFTPGTSWSLHLLRDVLTACPTIHTLSLTCHMLGSQLPWTSLPITSSTLQGLTLELHHPECLPVDLYPLDFPGLRTLALHFPDLPICATPTLYDAHQYQNRTALLHTLVWHAPHLSTLSVTGIRADQVIIAVEHSLPQLRLDVLQLGRTHVAAGLGRHLVRLSQALPYVQFFGNVTFMRGDSFFNEVMAWGTSVVDPAEEHIIHVRFDRPVGLLAIRVPPNLA